MIFVVLNSQSSSPLLFLDLVVILSCVHTSVSIFVFAFVMNSKSLSTKSLDRVGSSEGIVRPSIPPPLPPRKPTKDMDTTQKPDDYRQDNSLKETNRPQSVPPPPPPRKDVDDISMLNTGTGINNGKLK